MRRPVVKVAKAKKPAKRVKNANLTAVPAHKFSAKFFKFFTKRKKGVSTDFVAKWRRQQQLIKKRQNILIPSLVVISLLICGLSIYKPLKTYFQVKEKVEYNQKVAKDADESLAKKKEELNRWNDPAFVETQIRNRLSYVKKGETPYIVIEP